MGSPGLCVFLLVMFVQLQHVLGKPFFADLICEFLCDDDDDDGTTATTASSGNYDIFDLCSCGTQPPTGLATLPSNINMRLPPSPNGMTFNLSNNNGMLSFSLDAGVPNGSTGRPTAAPSGGPPGVVPLPAGANTPAPAGAVQGATTAAAAATTAAPAGKK